MLQVIPSGDRYHVENDWLSTYWPFSFDHYREPKNISFGPLRVFNDDVVGPAGGFPFHPHREMEIVTYVIDGQLEHRDTMGNRGVVTAGEVQRMTAGTGVRHSEFNPSEDKPVHLIQLWLLPAESGLTPSWEQKSYPTAQRTGKLLPIAVPAGSTSRPEHAVEVHQDATLYPSLLQPGQSVTHTLGARRRGYIFVVGGELLVNGKTLKAGDQARISDEQRLELAGPATGKNSGGSAAPGDFLFLDLP